MQRLYFNFMEKQSNNTYDIIIVGAGPAGSAAGLYASRHGLKTLLVDKESFPRDKICGDALSGKSVAVLRELDLLEKTQNLPGAHIQSIVFSSPDHTSFHIDLTKTSLKNIPKGFVIKRKIFDAFLFNEAKEAVTTTLQNFTVTDLIIEEGFVRGVKGKRTGDNEEVSFHSNIVFGADGFKSIVARKIGLYEHDPKHWVVALRCYYKNVADLTDQIELHYVDEVIPGYFWIFPLENGYANVGIGMLHEYIKRQNMDLKKSLEETIASKYFRDRFKEAEPMEKPIGWNLPIGSKRRKSYANGLILLGDAAGLIDPFTGEGIGNAMYSAKYAVQTVLEAQQANDFSEQFLSRFEDELWKVIGNELKVSTKLQKIGRSRFLLNLVINKAARNEDVSNIIAGMLANEVPRKRLANPLFYLKLLFS
ncbi:MAG: geranylgeranyl reductase family protein [Calditrichia bacterium]|nr:geranylgeranyl reductase family protein [Calditrichia bacterium]